MIIKFIKKVLASYQDRQAQELRDKHNRQQFRLAHKALEERGY